VTKGMKYMLRTDLVFEREARKEIDTSFATDFYYKKMILYYQQAAAAECVGNVEKSSRLYEKALSIRIGQEREW